VEVSNRKVDLLLKEIKDSYVQENFRKIQKYLIELQGTVATTINNTTVVSSVEEEDTFTHLVDTAISYKPTFTGSLLDSGEFYDSTTQVDANRLGKIDYTYNIDDEIETETFYYYEADGVTARKTETKTYTYSSGVLTKWEMS